jgi:hypothetical protein
MAGVGEPSESYHESKVRERRLQAYPHWDEIQVRLQHRWAPDRVIKWHLEKFPGAPCPPKTTLFRYVRSKPSGWFVSQLILAEGGTRTVRSQLVAERQSELIESMFMRLAAARQFEASMNGLLIPEVGRQYDLLDRMLVNHFRVLQETGLEPKHGSMAPTGAPAAESGTAERLLIQRIVDLPSDQFLALMHKHFAEKRLKAPLQPGEVIDVEAQVHEERPR